METEEMLINAYTSNPWENADAIPSYSESELITVALAVQRYDLIPDNPPDPLDVYCTRLDDRQRSIVDKYRGWQ